MGEWKTFLKNAHNEGLRRFLFRLDRSKNTVTRRRSARNHTMTVAAGRVCEAWFFFLSLFASAGAHFAGAQPFGKNDFGRTHVRNGVPARTRETAVVGVATATASCGGGLLLYAPFRHYSNCIATAGNKNLTQKKKITAKTSSVGERRVTQAALLHQSNNI